MRSFEKSNALLEREKKVAPLAAQTFSKSYRYFIPNQSPMYIERAEGSRIYDVDGNEFIDFNGCLGPITLGFNYPKVNEAIIEQLNKGIIFSTHRRRSGNSLQRRRERGEHQHRPAADVRLLHQL